MKIKNYAKLPIGESYVGLNAGTASLGWAVAKPDGELMKAHGKHMWGVIGFNEAIGTEDQRIARTNRRALQRRQQRLRWLEDIFAKAITDVDPDFFHRFHESGLLQEDRTGKNRFVLFNGPDYNDANYFSEYPTVYHLRQDLIYNKEPHDVRLVFLALHHLIKRRGHMFLKGDMSGDSNISAALTQLSAVCEDMLGTPFTVKDTEQFIGIMENADMSVTAKKKELCKLVEEEESAYSQAAICHLLAGATVNLAKIFPSFDLDTSMKISIDNDLSEQKGKLTPLIGDSTEILFAAQAVMDAVKLRDLLGDSKYLCDTKVKLYAKNRADKLLLRAYIRKNAPEKYAKIMKKRTKKSDKGGIPNFQAYIGKGESGDYRCNQAEFCAFLKKELPAYTGNDKRIIQMFKEIEEGKFLTRLHSKENRLIPYQIQRRELAAILDNAKEYLPFLEETDTDGISASNKIISIFEFHLPYYVGPLGNSDRAWAVRKESGPIYPWNFTKKIDEAESAQQFINRLTGRCTYTGEPVLPNCSLVYSEFKLLNELNCLKINGNPLSPARKQQMITDLFAASKSNVKKTKIEQYFIKNGWMDPGDIVTGIDVTVNSTLKSLIEMRPVLDVVGMDGAEEIIMAITCFGSNKKLLAEWLEKNFPKLSKEHKQYLSTLSFTGWGSLSGYFLTNIYSADINGEAYNIMDLLRSTSKNLMQLLSDDYEFSAKAQEHLTAVIGEDPSLDELLDYMYVSAPAKRTIHQISKLMTELTEDTGKAPQKIFFGVARDNKGEKGKRTEDRKKKLLSLYAENKKLVSSISGTIANELEKEDDENLQKDRVYLYYLQLGLCLYTGEKIPRSEADSPIHYNTEHILPRSKVRDDSLNNLLLVDAKVNQNRDQTYPLPKAIQDKMVHTWKMLRNAGFMSDTKYELLTRTTELTARELSAFVARQLNDTRQSTKAAAVVLRRMFPNTRLVLVKDINVSLFRAEFNLTKNRNVNDLHNAADAYLNIRVGDVYDQLFTPEFFANPKKYEYSINTKAIFGRKVKDAWNPDTSIEQVRRILSLHDAISVRRQFEELGTLYKVTIQSAGSGQVPKKQGLPIEKYGGYTSINSAFYCIVEHTNEKGKRIRTIEPVYVYMAKKYAEDPTAYCRDVLDLKDPVVLRERLLFDSLLEIKGKRYRVGGRTGSNVTLRHAYQLYLSPEHEKLLKAVQRYLERCILKRKDLPLTENSPFTEDDLYDLYLLFIEKINSKPYDGMFGMLQSHLEGNKETFKLLSATNKAKVLMEILEAFKPNPHCPDLSLLCGIKLCGRIVLNKKITPEQHFTVIDHSTSGLRERRTEY